MSIETKWRHWCEIMEKEDRRLDMLRASERKRGRVTCSWCGKDLGEAMAEEDTGGSCLNCVELALREVDERLAALGHGLAAGPPARERGRPAVKRVWRVGEPPVNLSVVYGPLGMVGTSFLCPGCAQTVTVEDSGEDLVFHCECGAVLHLRIEPRLEKLDGEG